VAVMHRGRWGRNVQTAGPARPKTDWRSYDHVADLYDRVRTEFHALPAADLLREMAPPAGGRILDVGTGTGAAALAATEAAGTEAMVVGIDPSLEMLGRARDRGVARVVAGEALDLPFRTGAFDAVVATFVIFFFTRYETALHDMVRVLRPGGKIGVTTWGGTEDEFRRTWRHVAESFVGKDLLKDAIRRAAPWEERFSDPGRLQESLRDAGFRQVHVQRRDYRHSWSIEDYLAGRETSAAGRFLRDMLGDASWERFRERVSAEFRNRFSDPIGDTSDVLLAVGTKPS
jgi:ubiquinone/menaquinone biosynthesis C-methylase UbiE